MDHALYWKKLDKLGHGLADYGNLDDLLEVVSTWIHEVPAMNAGNVYGMRFVASLLERRGDARAAQLRSEARDLAARINRLLYVEGKGWWKCGQPDGTFNEVRHCYDLLTVLDTMFEDLSAKQKQEMSHFFWSELHTPLWMHALSPRRCGRHLEHPCRPQLAGSLYGLALDDRQRPVQDRPLRQGGRLDEGCGKIGQPGSFWPGPYG